MRLPVSVVDEKEAIDAVEGGTIYVYEVDEAKALQVLKHEFVDYLITSRIVKPLVELVNLLIKSRGAEIYGEKERIVEILCKLVDLGELSYEDPTAR